MGAQCTRASLHANAQMIVRSHRPESREVHSVPSNLLDSPRVLADEITRVVTYQVDVARRYHDQVQRALMGHPMECHVLFSSDAVASLFMCTVRVCVDELNEREHVMVRFDNAVLANMWAVSDESASVYHKQWGRVVLDDRRMAREVPTVFRVATYRPGLDFVYAPGQNSALV